MHNMMRFNVKTPKVFDFGSWEDALLDNGQAPDRGCLTCWHVLTLCSELQRVASSCPRPP